MHPDAEALRDLRDRIQARRVSIQAYVRDAAPRAHRLTNIAIVSSAIVSVLTAGPALGGVKFTEAAASMLNTPNDALIWRGLCFGALILSLVAAISTNLNKSQDTAARLAKAESASGALEGLQTLVEFEQIPVGEAVQQYQQTVAEIPFIPDLSPPLHPGSGHPHVPPPPAHSL